jgi:hypothetical protein
VAAPAVISTYLILLFLMKVPIALNEIVPPVGTPSGPVLTMLVGLADGRGVSVGVTVFLGVGNTVGVGEGGAPLEIVMDSSAKPGVGVGRVPPPPPLPQLSKITPKTNNTTGATTSNLSHRDNIKP